MKNNMYCPRYIIFDTNCFLEAIKDNGIQHFDYVKLKKYVKEQGAVIVISAYSLYEIIQGIQYVADIEKLRNQLIAFGDFYVLDNKILDHEFLEYGIDFLFLLKFHSNETALEFAEKRKELRNKVYSRIFPRFFRFASLVAASYLGLKECDKDGIISNDACLRGEYILNYFWDTNEERILKKFEEYYEHAGYDSIDLATGEFFKDYDAKDNLREYLLKLIVEILAVSDARLLLHKKEIEASVIIYNEKIQQFRHIREKEITADSFRKVNTKAKKHTNGKKSIESILDEIFIDQSDSLMKDGYRYLVERLFNSGGFGKTINNDFIDLSNLVLIESIRSGNAVFLTYEKNWILFLEKHRKYLFVENSIEFSRHYEIR